MKMSGFARYANNVSVIADSAKIKTKKLKTEEKPSDKDDLKIFIDKLNDCVSNFYISDWCGVGRNNDNSCHKYSMKKCMRLFQTKTIEEASAENEKIHFLDI